MRKNAPRRFWSERELRTLARLYPSRSTQDIAKILGRGIGGVYGMARKLGLQKSPEYLQTFCRIQKGHPPAGSEKHRFGKGQVPFNKGLRRPGWSAGRMRETQFKKGHRGGIAAKNWRPVGTILPDSDGFLRIKMREAEHGKEATGFGNTQVWKLLNRHIWEQHNGPIPPKHLVTFKDGNRKNCVIENLELISMKENARRNRMWNRLPRPLAEAIQLNGALKRKIRRLHGEEQDRRSQKPSI